jgi:hypothetical protein
MHGGNSITRAVNHDCGSDNEARLHALDLLEAWPDAAIEVWEPDDAAIEVWELGRLVARQEQGAAESSCLSESGRASSSPASVVAPSITLQDAGRPGRQTNPADWDARAVSRPC